MAADVTYRVHGLDRLVRTLRKCGDDLSDLKDANARAGEIVANAARGSAPRVSGSLAASVRAARQARRAVVLAGRASVPYAAPIHWGWPARGIDPQPFLSEAAQRTEPMWVPLYLEDVKRAIAKVQGL